MERTGARTPILSALDGAALGSLVHALAFPGLAGWSWLATKVLLILPGNLMLAAVLAWGGGRILGPGMTARRTAWLGVAVGLGGLLGGQAAGPQDPAGRARYLVPLATAMALVVFLLAAGRWRLPVPGRRWAGAVAAACLLLAAGGSFLGIQPGTASARFSPGEREALPQSGGDAAPADAPAVLLLVVDTLRADVLAEVPTPALDALRDRSLRGEFAVAPYPGTLPSHVSMFTGTSILRHGARDNRDRMREDLPAVAGVFRRHGWRTLGLAANSVLDPATGIARGFEVFENVALRQEQSLRAAKCLYRGVPGGTWTGLLLPARLARAVILGLARQAIGDPRDLGIAGGGTVRDTALAYLDDLDAQDRPWFFFLHFMDPHLPYRPDPSVAGSLTAGLSLPERYRGDGEPGGIVVAHHVKEDLARGVPEALEAAAFLHDLYREEVMFLDRCIGAVLERVARCRRPVYILFTSDHGEFFGEHDRLLHGEGLYETVLRVPFLISGPGIQPGELPTTPRLDDVAPTLLALAGLPVPEEMTGRILTGVAKAEEPGWAATDGVDLAWYEGDWKLLLAWSGAEEGGSGLVPLGLYNVAEDPEERHDLRDQEPDRMAAMLNAARQAVAGAARRARRAVGEDEAARLVALGYGS